MKHLRQSLSELELTEWLVIGVLLALIVLTGFIFWAKASAYGP
jgi:hypothetical protein